MTIHDVFMNKPLNDFLKPTKITVVASFVFVFGLFYLYYTYGLLEMINAFFLGDMTEYGDSAIPYVADVANPWSFDPEGLALGLQAVVCIFLVYFLASLVSWVFYRFVKN